MEKSSASNFNQNSITGRRVCLIPATPRPALPPPPSSSSSTSSLIPSHSSSSNPQSGSPRGILLGEGSGARLPYPYLFRIGNTQNEELPPPAPAHQEVPFAGGRVRLTPTTPQRNASQEARTSRPLEMFGGDLYANIIREAMARIPPISEEEDEKDMSSEEIQSHASSSSLRFNTEDDDDKSGGGLNGRRKGKTFEELAEAAIREMREAEEERGKRPERMTQRGEPSRQAAEVNNEDPHERLIREMIDLTGTDDEADAEEDEWRKTLEETVDTLVAEAAEQREQTTRLVNLMERVVSWMDRETQSSSNPSPATSVAPLADPQQQNTDNAGPSRKRKETATTSQPPSGARKARRSDSSGSQRGN